MTDTRKYQLPIHIPVLQGSTISDRWRRFFDRAFREISEENRKLKEELEKQDQRIKALENS